MFGDGWTLSSSPAVQTHTCTHTHTDTHVHTQPRIQTIQLSAPTVQHCIEFARQQLASGEGQCVCRSEISFALMEDYLHKPLRKLSSCHTHAPLDTHTHTHTHRHTCTHTHTHTHGNEDGNGSVLILLIIIFFNSSRGGSSLAPCRLLSGFSTALSDDMATAPLYRHPLLEEAFRAALRHATVRCRRSCFSFPYLHKTVNGPACRTVSVCCQRKVVTI